MRVPGSIPSRSAAQASTDAPPNTSPAASASTGTPAKRASKSARNARGEGQLGGVRLVQADAAGGLQQHDRRRTLVASQLEETAERVAMVRADAAAQEALVLRRDQDRRAGDPHSRRGQAVVVLCRHPEPKRCGLGRGAPSGVTAPSSASAAMRDGAGASARRAVQGRSQSARTLWNNPPASVAWPTGAGLRRRCNTPEKEALRRRRIRERKPDGSLAWMNANLYTLFENHFGERQGEPCVLIPNGPVIHYDELAISSARIAHALVRAGCQPGDRVAAQVDKHWQALALYLACLRARARLSAAQHQLSEGRARLFF